MSRIYHAFEDALKGIVDDEMQPTKPLLGLLDLHEISHSGQLGGPGGIVEATRRAWQIFDQERQRYLKRDEIDRATADARFDNLVMRRRTFYWLRKMRFIGGTFLPPGLPPPRAEPKQSYDAALCFGSDLHNVISMRQLLVEQWRAGLRFPKIALLNAPREVAVADLRHREKAYPDAKDDEDLGDTRDFFGLKTWATGQTMWLWWWHHLPLPSDMRAAMGEEVYPIHVADWDRTDIGVPDSTIDWLTGFRHSPEAFLESDESYLIVASEPIIMRRCLATRSYLVKQGFTRVNVTALGEPEPTRTRSIAICLRELSLLLAALQQERAGR